MDRHTFLSPIIFSIVVNQGPVPSVLQQWPHSSSLCCNNVFNQKHDDDDDYTTSHLFTLAAGEEGKRNKRSHVAQQRNNVMDGGLGGVGAIFEKIKKS